MKLNFDHLQRCSLTLERSLQPLATAEAESIDYEVFRNALIKSFELTLETAGKLLRKVVGPFLPSICRMTFCAHEHRPRYHHD